MSTDTEPHLDLDELLAGVASEHLASCPGCRAERARWAKVSDGTQQLVAATDLPEWHFPAERPDRGPRRRIMLTAAAAAVVLAAAGTTWGLASRGAGTPSAAAAGLTAVTGCRGLAVTSGSLERISGTRLLVRTGHGQRVTVTTTGSTTVRTEVPGSLSDITNGAKVLVNGIPQGSTVAVRRVLVSRSLVLPILSPPFGGMSVLLEPGELLTLGNGTVTNVHPGGFTVANPGGRPVQLTTSGATRVDTLVTSGVDQLREGVPVTVVGRPSSGGTLAASAIEQGADLPDIKIASKRSATGTCDPAAIAGVIALGG